MVATSIINIQIGNCGAQLGHKESFNVIPSPTSFQFWEVVSAEHGLNANGHYEGSNDIQLDKIAVYYSSSNHGNYVPRSIMVDLETSSLDQIRASALGRIYRPDNFVSGAQSASNNWGKGYYTDGAELCDQVMELVRKETESCDVLQGYQIMHSIGGGTGSGLGSRLLLRLREEYPDRIICSYSVYPSPKVSDVIVEPYNAVLTVNKMIEFSDESFVLDNEALYNIAQRTLKLTTPSLNDLNHVISFALSGLTTCLRFPGQLNADLRKLAVNMVPFPRLHFFVPGYVPLYGIAERRYKALTVPDLIQQMLQPENMMAACNTRKGKYLTAACVFRGLVSTKEVETCLTESRNRSSRNFVHWIPGNLSRAICDVAAPGQKLTATFLGNTTSLQAVMVRIMEQYSAMYKRQAFLHWYLGEGMEKEEFEESECTSNDLIAEYQLYETCE